MSTLPHNLSLAHFFQEDRRILERANYLLFDRNATLASSSALHDPSCQLYVRSNKLSLVP